jgi:anti-anti-sigma factor
VAQIRLAGELDAGAAPTFRDQVEEAADAHVQRLVIFMTDLTYMASAGLRALIFAKQKMGSAVDVYVIAPQEQVLDTLRRTGLLASVFIKDEDQVAG